MNVARIATGRDRHGLKWICLSAIVAALPASLQGAEKAPEVKGMRDAATHELIVENGRVAREEAAKDEIRKQQLDALRPVPPEQRPAPPEKRSLLADSDIICFNGLATMVPKRAMLHVPKNLAGRIGMQDGSRLVTFDEFIAQNRAWLTSSEVTRAQAEGGQPLSESVTKSFAKETRIVVATYYEGPISVLPLKVPAPETAAATPATAGANAAAGTTNTNAAKK